MPLQSLLILGAGGMLAFAVDAAARRAAIPTSAVLHDELDVTDHHAMRALVARVQPTDVFMGAAYTRVDDAESNEPLAFSLNAHAVSALADACNECGARLVYPSTDYVFDGNSDRPYAVDATTNPLNAYGRSKVAGEAAARTAARHLIVRTCWLYGPGGRNFVRTVVDRTTRGEKMRVVDDQLGSPSWTHDIADGMLRLLQAEAPNGVYHLTNSGSTTWYDFACAIIQKTGIDAVIERCSTSEFSTPARRPAYSVLDCSSTVDKIGKLRSWQSGLEVALATGAY